MLGGMIPSRRTTLGLAAVVLAGASTLTLAACTSDSSAGPPQARSDPGPMADVARQVLGSDAPGFLARIDDGTDVRYTVAGLADRDTGRKLAAGDQFEIGSITKTFVATLILQLADQNRVDLDGAISDYLPGVVPNGKNITVEMLLNHTSGLFNYTDDKAFFAALTQHPQKIWTPQQLLRIAFRPGPNFSPGTNWSYSNTNYIVAGLMLEKLTGQKLPDLVQQQIVKPLGLKHTYLADPRADNTGPGYAHGYTVSYSGPAPDYQDTATWPIGGWGAADGGIIASSDDVSRFLSALLGGKILSDAQLDQMKTTVDLPARFHTEGGYGLGLSEYVSPCGPVWGHEGATLGHRSTAFASEDGKRTAVTDITARAFDPDLNPGVQRFDQVATAVQDATVCLMLGKPVPASVTAALHSTTYRTAL